MLCYLVSFNQFQKQRLQLKIPASQLKTLHNQITRQNVSIVALWLKGFKRRCFFSNFRCQLLALLSYFNYKLFFFFDHLFFYRIPVFLCDMWIHRLVGVVQLLRQWNEKGAKVKQADRAYQRTTRRLFRPNYNMWKGAVGNKKHPMWVILVLLPQHAKS